MMNNLFYLLIGLSTLSFGIGFVYRFKMEKEMKNKYFNSNKIERLDALQFAYYFMGIGFLLFGLGMTATLFN